MAPAILGIAAALGLALLVGCGQKGPLFLPDTRPPVVEQPATPAATTPDAAAPAPKTPDKEEEKPR